MLAQAAQSGFSTEVAMYPLAIVALGGLVKWWMSGTERSIKAVAEDVSRLVRAHGEQAKELAVLDERVKRLREDHDRLHSWKNEFVEGIGAEPRRK